ncbi:MULTISPECIES: sugar ABC transporter ATP-binding protein [unclassified Actinomyces]|uniref:sugar ABC transporter ATP-binding protein n=1 Tax=unclassified Actinomyces TaxID=2609248 RepID=UPI0020174331|nr:MULTISPECIES: sugar ABC transporter ATP-binding protein [unclassified Actinomyces]MCL3777140.1 sugar ABC transporter ATP-binding protein [Actinomyces sp. AC-20-1]MCL3788944.1 sugar ABC transporter ATP-binding protein [Actinomyces sp. 187325]MCL3791326.1 sugar ABC transporter ATP-binding protein [Actinomyces sp. 186855]MCL3794157.1 sugar ABC transporter ATP-binding protein [Actinomyces sp. 217892]
MATPTDAPPRTPVVEMTGITITFPGVRALDDVDVTLYPGEVHALMGENGAGKSTLIKALTGVNTLTAGRIVVDGKEVSFSGPAEAQEAGVAVVFQEVNLCANLSVAENVMLGHEPTTGPFISWRAMRQQAKEHLARLHLDIDPSSTLGSHTIATQQLCAIARALVVDAKVLILDEPTSSLDKDEVAELFAVVRELKSTGVAILFVSHFLDQVYEISDRMTVLRNGRLVGTALTQDLPRSELISMMIGKDAAELESIGGGVHDSGVSRTGEPVLHAIGISKRGSVEAYDLGIHPGEIIGVAGLLGSGRTEAARLLAGVDRTDTGTLKVKGAETRLSSPLAAVHKGIVYSTEDRKKEGIVGDLTVRENIALALQASRGAWRPIPRKELDEIVERYMEALDIHPRNPGMLIKNLSGGNQQKVLLARWLATAPELLILDEPTRGIDVGTKAEIQRLVAQLAGQGMSVVFISSELEEVLRLSHRIMVMRDRAKIAEIDNGPGVTAATILSTIAAQKEESHV